MNATRSYMVWVYVKRVQVNAYLKKNIKPKSFLILSLSYQNLKSTHFMSFIDEIVVTPPFWDIRENANLSAKNI